MNQSNIKQCDKYQAYELNVSQYADEPEICAAIDLLAQDDLAIRITLVGGVEIALDIENITKCCQESFLSLQLVDNTELLGSALVQEMAQENTVHGIVVKRLLELSRSTTDEHQLRIYDLTLRELLSRFEMMQGENR
ncbi:MAG: hypothetical protein RBR22_06600 [Desulfuromonas sp.]|nr:hypothetical protein [Desulfuromonas sp.]